MVIKTVRLRDFDKVIRNIEREVDAIPGSLVEETARNIQKRIRIRANKAKDGGGRLKQTKVVGNKRKGLQILMPNFANAVDQGWHPKHPIPIQLIEMSKKGVNTYFKRNQVKGKVGPFIRVGPSPARGFIKDSIASFGKNQAQIYERIIAKHFART